MTAAAQGREGLLGQSRPEKKRITNKLSSILFLIPRAHGVCSANTFEHLFYLAP